MKHIIPVITMVFSVILFLASCLVAVALPVLDVSKYILALPVLAYCGTLFFLPQDRRRFGRCILARAEILISWTLVVLFALLYWWSLGRTEPFILGGEWLILLLFAVAPLIQIRGEIWCGTLLGSKAAHHRTFFFSMIIPLIALLFLMAEALFSSWGWASGLEPVAVTYMIGVVLAGFLKKRSLIMCWLPILPVWEAVMRTWPNNPTGEWFVCYALFFAILAMSSLPEIACEVVRRKKT